MGAAESLKAAYSLIRNDAYITVKATGRLDNDESRKLLEEITAMIKEIPAHVIVDCASVPGALGTWLRTLMAIAQALKDVEKQIRLVQVPKDFLQLLKQEGVSQVLKCCASPKDALSEFSGGSVQRVLDVNFINPFLVATMKVLEMQASTKATTGQIYKKEARDSFNGDISGVIGLVSDAFSGSVVVSFPSATFLKIMSRMLGEEFKEMTKDLEDGAGEMINIIFGQAKVMLNERGYGIKTALPSVVSGKDHSVIQMTRGPRVIVPFQSDAGEFFVEICLSE